MLSACGSGSGLGNPHAESLASLAADEINADPESLSRDDNRCLGSDSSACLIWKNPVAANEAPLSSQLSVQSNLGSLQTLSVQLVGLNNADFLENSSIRIVPAVGARARRLGDGSFRFAYSNCVDEESCAADNNHKLGQVSTYFWLTLLKLTMIKRTGVFYAAGKNFSVNTYEPGLANAYFSPDQRTIALGAANPYTMRDTFEFSLSAEVAAHEYGHANVFAAAGRYLSPSSQTHTRNFSACSSYKGCYQALNEGLADYHALMLFPERATIGESIVNNERGLYGRNTESNRNLRLSDAFSSSNGEIHLLGGVLTSMLWEVRMDAGSDPHEVDTLVSESLSMLNGNETFETYIAKLQAIDANLYRGKYSTRLQAEASRRGL